MNFDDIFEAYYAQYRAEADTPASTDDEYPVAMRLANEAVNRWSHYDNTLWKELYQTAQAEGDGELVLVDGQTEYATPANFVDAGGSVVVTDATTGRRMMTIPIIEPQEIQFMSDTANYCSFIGNNNGGYTLVINPAPQAPYIGMDINYMYYKAPTKFKSGRSVTEMKDPYFIVHRMLANRFRSSRNPYYSSAKTDAEDSLRTMQLTNNSGSWGNPWEVPDRSGTQFGG